MVGDRNAVLIATRISGYGADYETQINCPSCGEKSRMTFDLNNQTTKETSLDETLNLTRSASGNFCTIMPLSKFKIEFKLLKGKDEIYLTQLSVNKQKGKLADSSLTDQYKTMIVCIEGEKNQELINRYVNNMPTQDSRHLRACYRLANPDVQIIENFECSSCGHEQELEVPFGADFFWPNR